MCRISRPCPKVPEADKIGLRSSSPANATPSSAIKENLARGARWQSPEVEINARFERPLGPGRVESGPIHAESEAGSAAGLSSAPKPDTIKRTAPIEMQESATLKVGKCQSQMPK